MNVLYGIYLTTINYNMLFCCRRSFSPLTSRVFLVFHPGWASAPQHLILPLLAHNLILSILILSENSFYIEHFIKYYNIF